MYSISHVSIFQGSVRLRHSNHYKKVSILLGITQLFTSLTVSILLLHIESEDSTISIAMQLRHIETYSEITTHALTPL